MQKRAVYPPKRDVQLFYCLTSCYGRVAFIQAMGNSWFLFYSYRKNKSAYYLLYSGLKRADITEGGI